MIMTISGYSSDMFVKITTSGPRQYVKLVESYRDPSGPRHSNSIVSFVILGK